MKDGFVELVELMNEAVKPLGTSHVTVIFLPLTSFFKMLDKREKYNKPSQT